MGRKVPSGPKLGKCIFYSIVSSMSDRASLNIPVRVTERLRAIAKKLGQTPNSVATSMIEGCADACEASRAQMPPVVKLYRSFERKDIDLVDRLSLAILSAAFPKWEEDDELWREMLGRLIDAHVDDGKTLDQATIKVLGREARKLANALGKQKTDNPAATK